MSAINEHMSVYEHQKRREWGLGIVAWERGDRRGYVFESGHLRVLARPFYSLMREVKRSPEEVRELYQCLKPELDAARAEHGPLPRARDVGARMSFADQLAVFRAEYPAGFSDERWLREHRGVKGGKRGGATREAAMIEARELLGAQRLKKLLAEQAYADIYRDLHTVLCRCEIVPAAERVLAETSDPERQRLIAIAIVELLHGKGESGSRFSRFLAAFSQATGQAPGWHLATALPALLDPSEHVLVSPAPFRAQAKLMMLGSSIPTAPTAAGYLHCQKLAKMIATRLAEHELPPRDLLDVLELIRFTTHPRAKRRLAEMKRTA